MFWIESTYHSFWLFIGFILDILFQIFLSKAEIVVIVYSCFQLDSFDPLIQICFHNLLFWIFFLLLTAFIRIIYILVAAFNLRFINCLSSYPELAEIGNTKKNPRDLASLQTDIPYMWVQMNLKVASSFQFWQTKSLEMVIPVFTIKKRLNK